jgi:hypothetical protein
VLIAATAVAELGYFGLIIVRPGSLMFEQSARLVAFAVTREHTAAWLSADPGSDLVFVEYGPDHSYHQEWVYNRADIDGSEIVWARDMGDSKNRALVSYYANRRVWVLTATGADSTSVEPYRERIVLEPYLDIPSTYDGSEEPGPGSALEFE